MNPPRADFTPEGLAERPVLCSKHDAELFKSIDTEPLDVDNCEHLRQLAYRSVKREFNRLQCAWTHHRADT